MKFFLLTVACLVGASLAAPADTTKVKRDILEGDARFGTEYHLQHQHVHGNNEVQSTQSVGGYAGSYSAPPTSYGPPNFNAGTPINTVQQQKPQSQVQQSVQQKVQKPSNAYLSPMTQQSSPVLPSTSYGAPFRQAQPQPQQASPSASYGAPVQQSYRQAQPQPQQASNKYLAPAAPEVKQQITSYGTPYQAPIHEAVQYKAPSVAQKYSYEAPVPAQVQHYQTQVPAQVQQQQHHHQAPVVQQQQQQHHHQAPVVQQQQQHHHQAPVVQVQQQRYQAPVQVQQQRYQAPVQVEQQQQHHQVFQVEQHHEVPIVQEHQQVTVQTYDAPSTFEISHEEPVHSFEQVQTHEAPIHTFVQHSAPAVQYETVEASPSVPSFPSFPNFGAIGSAITDSFSNVQVPDFSNFVANIPSIPQFQQSYQPAVEHHHVEAVAPQQETQSVVVENVQRAAPQPQAQPIFKPTQQPIAENGGYVY